jgi:chemotaxis methyl-accepting protein methylase
VLDQPCESLRAVISEHSKMRHFNSAADFVKLLRSSPAHCDDFLEAVLGGDSDFLCHSAPFEVLQKQALPEIARKQPSREPNSLRIWSAGCGTGEEAYSIALSVCEALDGSRTSWNIHIVASDIRRAALKIAERGLYPESKLGKLPRAWISSYFSRVGDHFLVKPRLRNLISFSPMNFTQVSFIGHFDFIFCIDVLPHFSASQRSALLQRFRMFLEPGGYLFLGENEKISGDQGLEYTKYLDYTYYRRPLAAAASAR